MDTETTRVSGANGNQPRQHRTLSIPRAQSTSANNNTATHNEINNIPTNSIAAGRDIQVSAMERHTGELLQQQQLCDRMGRTQLLQGNRILQLNAFGDQHHPASALSKHSQINQQEANSNEQTQQHEGTGYRQTTLESHDRQHCGAPAVSFNAEYRAKTVQSGFSVNVLQERSRSVPTFSNNLHSNISEHLATAGDINNRQDFKLISNISAELSHQTYIPNSNNLANSSTCEINHSTPGIRHSSGIQQTNKYNIDRETIVRLAEKGV